MTSREPRVLSDELISSLIEERWPGAEWFVSHTQYDHESDHTVVYVRVQPPLDYIEISFSVELDTDEMIR
jgi:hypothetical protein